MFLGQKIGCPNYDNQHQLFSETSLKMMLATFHGEASASVKLIQIYIHRQVSEYWEIYTELPCNI